MVGQADPASPPLLPFHNMSHRCLAALCRQMVCFFAKKIEFVLSTSR